MTETLQMAELTTYLPNQATPFIVHGNDETLEALAADLQAADARDATRKHKVSTHVAKAAVEAPTAVTEPTVNYQPATIKTKVQDWLSDTQWRKVDRELGTTIVQERKEQRLAERILVARQAAGVDKAPVWGKHKAALKLAEKALTKS